MVEALVLSPPYVRGPLPLPKTFALAKQYQSGLLHCTMFNAR